MKLILESIKSALPTFNRRAHIYEDFETIARSERIIVTVCDYNEDTLGYYCIRRTRFRKKKFIVINARLSALEKTLVGFHELGHHFLHVPASARHYYYCRRAARLIDSKQDAEADAFALIMMIPLKVLFELQRTPFEEIHPYLAELCVRRKRLFEEFGV